MAHPVEGRAQVIDQLLAGEGGAHFASQFGGLGYVRIAGLDPQKVRVGSEFASSLGGGGEAGTVVVESFTGPGDIAGPDDRGLGKVARQSSATRDGEVGILLHPLLISIPRGLRRTFGLEMRIHS